MSKKNAIMLSFSDNYSFAAANVLMSIRDNSPKLFDECEFIIYQDDLSEQNRNVLLKIRPGIRFMGMERHLPEYVYKNAKRWGSYITQKLHAFLLLNEYHRILWLDCDVYVNKNLDYLFEIDCDIAYQNEAISDPDHLADLVHKRFGSLVSDYRCMPFIINEGVVVFNDSINRFNITGDDICRLAEEFGTVHSIFGGIDGSLILLIAYHYKMNCVELPEEYNMMPYNPDIYRSTIQHFHAAKPWQDEIIYMMFPKWGENHDKFVKLGGTNYPELHMNPKLVPKFDYSTSVIRSVSVLSPVFGSLDILKDPLFDLDFYRDQSCPRFYLKDMDHQLYIDVDVTPANQVAIDLVMRRRLRGKENDRIFSGFLETINDIPEKAELTELRNHDLQIQLKYKEVEHTNLILNRIASYAKSRLTGLARQASQRVKIYTNLMLGLIADVADGTLHLLVFFA